jgi:peptidoglycan L-alanyl-D-glutamate endopeptidase CwlK
VSSGLVVNRDFQALAPNFANAVRAALDECNRNGLDAFVYEAYRSQELQALYYARGRTVKPPATPVTNASSNLYSWHGYGLAVDVISRSREWSVPDAWYRSVSEIFIRSGCRWGGGWTRPDLPHFQWGHCRPSPSDLAREIMGAEGKEGVWREVGAL